MTKLLFIISLFYSLEALACLEVLGDDNGEKGHPTIKHFHHNFDKHRIVAVRNYRDDEVCRFKIASVEMIQNSSGRYRFMKTRPGMNLKRSVSPYLDLRDENGISILDTELSIEPKTTAIYYFHFNFPESAMNGSYHGGIEFDYLHRSVSFLLVQLNYSFSNDSAKLSLSRLTFDDSKQILSFIIRNSGGSYTFFRGKLVFSDPYTGFESTDYTVDTEETLSYYAYMSNRPLPSSRNIKVEYSLKNYLRLVKKDFAEKFPDLEFSTTLNVTILPEYGIDHVNWKNHYYKKMKLNSIKINTL